MRVFVILSALAIFAFANPAPLGFEIDKATYDEVKAKYPIKHSAKSYTGGIEISVDSKNVELDGLMYDVNFWFDEKGKLVSVSFMFKKNKYDELLQSLYKKYKFVEKITGNNGAVINTIFEDDNCIIRLNANFNDQITGAIHLYYKSKDEIKRLENKIKEREQKSKDNLKSL